MPKTIKVLVVDDSAFMRKVIGDILAEDPRFEVVARAKDGVVAEIYVAAGQQVKFGETLVRFEA